MSSKPKEDIINLTDFMKLLYQMKTICLCVGAFFFVTIFFYLQHEGNRYVIIRSHVVLETSIHPDTDKNYTPGLYSLNNLKRLQRYIFLNKVDKKTTFYPAIFKANGRNGHVLITSRVPVNDQNAYDFFHFYLIEELKLLEKNRFLKAKETFHENDIQILSVAEKFKTASRMSIFRRVFIALIAAIIFTVTFITIYFFITDFVRVYFFDQLKRR